MQTKVAYFDHPAGVDEAIGSAQVAVEPNGRVVDVNDALEMRSSVGTVRY